MSLTPTISAIKNASSFGTLKLNDDKTELKPKAYYNVGIAWVKDGFNVASNKNNIQTKEKFRAELSKSFKGLDHKVWQQIDQKMQTYRDYGPLSMRTAKAVIKIAERGNAGFNADMTLSIGTKLKLGLVKTFMPLLKNTDPVKIAKFLGGNDFAQDFKSKIERDKKQNEMHQDVPQSPRIEDEFMMQTKDNVEYHLAELKGELKSDEEKETTAPMDSNVSPPMENEKKKLGSLEEMHREVVEELKSTLVPKHYDQN